jgi:hypothetical protein
MKRIYTIAAVTVLCMMALTFAAYAESFMDDNPHSYLHSFWEGKHATMINCLLITDNDAIVKNSGSFVKLGQVYSERDPLIKVYGLRERFDDDSDKDAFLVGLKANNLIYLIHVADDNPAAKKLAIKELRLLAKNVHDTQVKREFPYWADLLEEGRYSSHRLSHLYVHYTINIGDFYWERMDINKRFLYWLGYLINDFTVANLCGHEEWCKEDQKLLDALYSVRIHGHLAKSIESKWDSANIADLSLKEAIDKTQKYLDYIKGKMMNRQMGK